MSAVGDEPRKETGIHFFKDLGNAARFALRCRGVALVFDGPEDDFVVAIGREARELQEDGHEPYTLQETARAARGEPVEEGENAT